MKKSGDFRRASDEFHLGIARICRLYGLSPLLGHLYAELYLHDEPLALEVVAERVGAAKSTVSVALRKLLSARVVRRVQSRGDRRDLYEAIVDPWAIFADWSRLFLQPEIAMWRETGGALERSLDTAPDDVNRAELQSRLAQMHEFVESIESVLGQLAHARPATSPARSIPIRIDASGDKS